MKKNKTNGFSLIELLIVVSLITILTSLAYLSYSQYSTEAENTKKQADVDAIQSNIELDILKSESFPSSIQ